MPSQIPTHAHSALIASGALASFNALVGNPEEALRRTLPYLAVVQFGYALLCLDSSGGGGGGRNSRARSGKKKQKKPTGTKDVTLGRKYSDKLLSTFLALVLSSTAGTLTLYLAMVLFGAPLTSQFARTFLCAAHLALVAAFPLVCARGVDAEKWREVLAVQAPVGEAFAGAVGALVGAWAGAVPIPLDWDREWQQWPVTIVAGAYGGYLVGKTLGAVFRGSPFPF